RVGLQNVMFASKLGFNLDIPEVAAFRKKVGTFVVLAKIAEIVEDGPWWYSACMCGRGVQAESGIYFCQFYNIHVTNVTL
ncbi:hypothetical protein S83_060469, partial [Arachis hypogaea]